MSKFATFLLLSMKTKRLDMTKYQQNSSKTVRPVFIHRYVISSTSLSRSILPNEWKLSNIVPIPKKGPAEEVSDYRPISLLSLVSKVFEGCVYNQLISHISSQLRHLQFGFLRGKSTTSQLLHVLQDIHQALGSRNQVDAVCIWTLQKRWTRLVISFCWLNFTSLE